MSFSFLLGMLAFCICSFVSVNGFGFALEGAWCSLDRIYYDFKNGQLKESYPRWIGLKKLSEMIENFNSFEGAIRNSKGQQLDQGEYDAAFNELKEKNEDNYFKYDKRYEKIKVSYSELKEAIGKNEENEKDNKKPIEEA